MPALVLMAFAAAVVLVLILFASPWSAKSCSKPVRSLNASGMTDVFQLTPGSTGTICVNYVFRGAGIYLFWDGYGPWFSQNGTYYGCGFNWNIKAVRTRCSEVAITPSRPGVINLFGGNVTVAYTVRSGQSASGLYMLSTESCGNVILVFGSLPASVPEFQFCVAAPYPPTSVDVTGVSNMKVVAIPAG